MSHYPKKVFPLVLLYFAYGTRNPNNPVPESLYNPTAQRNPENSWQPLIKTKTVPYTVNPKPFSLNPKHN